MAAGMQAEQTNYPTTLAPSARKPVLGAAGGAIPVLLPTPARSTVRRKTCRCQGNEWAGRGAACNPLLQPRAER